jgi:Zn-dependent M28 family amino/carboxypeptidase
LLQAPPPSADADTKAWWSMTALLSSDAMDGRDAGSPGYQRAADLVARRLAAAGLEPLGDGGTWFQSVPMDEVAVTHATIEVGGRGLRFLSDIIVPAQAGLAELDAPIVYRGYCAADALGDVRGKLVICHGTRRAGLPGDADRMRALTEAGAAGIISIADPGFALEPPRWPSAYVRSVALAGSPTRSADMAFFRLNADALGKVIHGSGRDAAALIEAGSSGAPLPSFDLSDRLRASFTTATRTLSSPNVIGMLPGTDPARAGEAIVLTAHLDGYGFGEPVEGDSLYNGTLDDAAYVALLVRLAERRAGEGFLRPLILAVFTGEEKGLLGSNWFMAHPPLPKDRMAANINLDQLRPIFPLELLTVHALDDTSLGDDARAVASALGITVQNDPEPERRLLQRSDHWTFLRAGIPAVNFVFGFRPGTESERIYRRWYREGYHTPQDDPNQHIDWKAAADFNRFFYALVERVADQDGAPAWKPTSKLRPQAK